MEVTIYGGPNSQQEIFCERCGEGSTSLFKGPFGELMRVCDTCGHMDETFPRKIGNFGGTSREVFGNQMADLPSNTVCSNCYRDGAFIFPEGEHGYIKHCNFCRAREVVDCNGESLGEYPIEFWPWGREESDSEENSWSENEEEEGGSPAEGRGV
jgi:hypothetical protein